MGLVILANVRFVYYGIDEETGNKKQYYYCFKHAVKEVIENDTDLINEVVDDEDLWTCHKCREGD